MSDLSRPTAEQMARLAPHFEASPQAACGGPAVLSGIIFVNRNRSRWHDAPKEYGPHRTLELWSLHS